MLGYNGFPHMWHSFISIIKYSASGGSNCRPDVISAKAKKSRAKIGKKFVRSLRSSFSLFSIQQAADNNNYDAGYCDRRKDDLVSEK